MQTLIQAMAKMESFYSPGTLPDWRTIPATRSMGSLPGAWSFTKKDGYRRNREAGRRRVHFSLRTTCLTLEQLNKRSSCCDGSAQ